MRGKGEKGEVDVERQAWYREPPRGGQPLSRDQTFVRYGLTWAGEWLRRHGQRSEFVMVKPFALVLCEETGFSPRNDSYLVGKTPDEIAMGAHSCPVGAGVIFVTSNIGKARGIPQEFGNLQALLNFLKAEGLLTRDIIIIDPAQKAAGVHKGGETVEDFETQIIVDTSPNSGPLTTDLVKKRLSDAHKNFFELPKQPFRRRFWLNPTQGKTVEHAEKVIQEILMYVFVTAFGDGRVLCDDEVQVPSGRADIRLAIAKDDSLRLFWLELKVLRESDGPTGRKTNAMTCIDQAKARRRSTEAVTEAAFACCYDASLAPAEFGTDLTGHAANDPEVKLCKYNLKTKLY